ncbi:hypothetical protein FN976_04695 [Caenimonas sedimenti]|uniref:Uncharacterized protein n=1 Tax=Caenimonas sedimenti TaxID=2596921 RepID=A0A562ZU66_9BURK|nr:hypothetical protein [Caenimonas sedimenti]TWO72023.1 hypothetical protein FN976_04695 [Caenimonas sedimenti]
MRLHSPSLSERVICALVAAVFGAVLGAVVAWLLGVFSATLGTAFMDVSFSKCIAAGAMAFALLGAILGTSMGTFVGHAISAIFHFERLESSTGPWWAFAILLVVAGMLTIMLHQAGP